MIKIFHLLFILSISLYALSIDKTQNYYDFNDFKIYQDKHGILSKNNVLMFKSEFEKNQKTNIGIKKYPVWTFGKIINNTEVEQRLVFVHPRAGIDFMDIYVYKDNKLIKEFKLGDMNPLENRIIESRKSNFFIPLEPKNEYEVFIKYKSFGAIDINLEVYQPKIYANIVKNESMYFGLIIGGISLILIILVVLMIYFPSVSTTLFFFILLGSAGIQLSVAGVFYEMGLNSYINTIISWSFGNIAAAFIGIFPIYYFKLKSILPKTTLVLKVLSYILILLSCSFLIYPFYNEILYLAPLANILFFIITLVLVFVSFKLYIKKVDGYKIFAFGNGLFLLCIIYFIFGLLGIVSTNKLFYFSLVFGTFINIFCLGYLIFANLIKIKKDKEEALLMINAYSKLSSVGQSMINLSHQWKEPLNHIYYAINSIQAAREFKDKDFDKILDNSIRQIKDTASHMTNTGKNFLSLYEDKTYEEKISVKTSIESVLIIFKKQIDELNLELDLKLQDGIFLNTNKYLLANIFMAIIENAIKIFKQRKIKNPKLSITIKKEIERIIIEISDNAGGIKEAPINSIFEKDMTNSNSTGLGLYLVKNILTLKLNGDVIVQNKDVGACFKVIL